MEYHAISIRPFVGSKNFITSRNFYQEIGFSETKLGADMCFFQNQKIGFYLQNAFVQDWVDNTMIFLEVEDLDQTYHDLFSLDLKSKYPEVKLIPIRSAHWGREFFLHDPAGILWHFGSFN
ncbi:glyoxalase [Pedobacter aquatilis]|uniref:glyoxalase n=1 Tax=Pedobacter aquatilis TaxID=351343 RepID=UPI002930A7E8|nr:glyoxalase [Pedobacter aquatilis]